MTNKKDILNIYCPKCTASDGLQVALDLNLHCPQCSTDFVILYGGLVEKGNDSYEFTSCKVCGTGRFVHHAFLVPDGHDDVDWDFDDWCENPQCPSNNPPKVETNTEFGEVVPEENKRESIIL
jgi:transcription elongation factor Elf1